MGGWVGEGGAPEDYEWRKKERKRKEQKNRVRNL